MRESKVTLVTTGEIVKRKPVNGAAKGAKFERDLADYFVSLGYAGARRMIRTGTVKHADEGDIDGLPFTVQAKNIAKPVTDGQIAQWGTEAGMQALARGHSVGIVVVKRNGHGAIGRSWVHTTMLTLSYLTGVTGHVDFERLLDLEKAKVRVSLDDIARILVRRYPPE